MTFSNRSKSASMVVALSLGAASHAATPKPDPGDNTATSRKHKEASKTYANNAESITVKADARRPHLAAHTPLGALGNRSEFDTPFSLSVVSAAKVEQIQAVDIADVFRAEPGVQQNSNGGSTASGASFRVRGLNLDWTNGYKIDGFAIPYWYIDLPMANFGQFQLFKGASGFLYGFGSPGAVMDFQLKKPVDTPKLALEAGYRSDAVFRQSLDAGGPLDHAGRVTTRLAIGNEVGNQYNGSFLRSTSVSGSIHVRLTDTLDWHGDAFYLNTLQKGMVNGVSVSSSLHYLSPISGRAELGAPDSWKTNDFKHFNTGFDWRFAPNWTARLTYAYTHLDERFPSNAITFLDNKGDYLNRPFQMTRVFTYHQAQETTEGTFKTGQLRHDVVAGITWLLQDFDADANAAYYPPNQYGNIYTTRPTATNGTAYNPRLYRYVDYTQVSPFWSDTVTWGKWSLLAGARYTDYIENDYATNGSGRRTAARQNNPVTPVVSLSYKPDAGINLYFSWVQAMQSGTQAAATAKNAYAVFAPMRSDQYEVGAKFQRNKWSGTIALYRMDTIASYVDSNNVQQQGGLVRYQGVEAAANVEATRDLQLSASLTYLDARYGSGTPYKGKQAESTSPFEANFSAIYTLRWVKGLSVNGGLNYVSAAWLNPDNNFRMPSYIIGNVGAQYITRVQNHRLTFRASVQNIGNERYWVSRGSLQLFPGAPRTATVSARIDF
ncbi:TonB-dependent siderophore receptor [Acetobacter sacchari]|uniref:TonB-dependent siderophore receptor n=1 Tax=Acetobacter sacchari TaxID=2661687 RepID=A0ABS3LTG7_9PROT|nr:TonB-dependent siderophore receptor [Acetobacter sacchari]MBO1359203.1 TonB-dependent siderophore receptor [Acetobacter sacchari]